MEVDEYFCDRFICGKFYFLVRGWMTENLFVEEIVDWKWMLEA